jgi:hypothetical protein
VQVDPIKHMLKVSGTKHLKLICDEPLSKFAFKFKLRRYNWDAVEAIWNHTLKKRLVVEPNEHPILLGEPVHTTRAGREKMVELLFEKHNPPGRARVPSRGPDITLDP